MNGHTCASRLLGAVAIAVILAAPARALDAPSAPTQSAAVLIEKGAYAEEHERDLAAAERLYRDAVRAAEGAGDASEKKAAEAALERVEARQGKAGTVPAGASAGGVASGAEQRIYELLKTLARCSGTEHSLASDEALRGLKLFGAAAVPMLEDALEGRPVMSARNRRAFEEGALPQGQAIEFTLDPQWAARGLVELEDPAAEASLARGLESPDPYIRGAVAGALARENQSALFKKALRDAVPGVRAVARDRLNGLHLRGVLREGILDPTFPDEERVQLFDIYGGITSPSPDAVREFAAAAESAPDSKLAKAIRGWLARVASSAPLDEPTRACLERLALENLDRDPESAGRILRYYGDRHAAEVLLARRKAKGALSKELEEALGEIAKRLGPKDVALVIEIWKCEERPNDEVTGRLDQLVRDDSTTEAFLRGLDGLSGERRLRYIGMLTFSHRREFAPYFRELLSAAEVRRVLGGLRALAALHDPAARPVAMARLGDGGDIGGAAWDVLHEWAVEDPAGAARALETRILSVPSGTAVPEGLITAIWALREPAALLRRLVERGGPELRRDILSEIVRWAGPREKEFALVVEHWKELAEQAKSDALKAIEGALYEPAIPVIGEALKDPDPKVRKAAESAFHALKKQLDARKEFEAWEAGDREGRETVAKLVEILQDAMTTRGAPDVAIGAIRSLGAIRARSALPVLAQVRGMWPDHPEVAQAVDEAIARIGGK